MAEVKQEAPKELTPAERALKKIAEKKAFLEKLENDAWENASKASEKYMKSQDAPIFVPFKDRDGAIVPALVLGCDIADKRDAVGELVLSKEREVQKEAQIKVWVFSHTSEPHRAVWTN